MSYTAKHVTYQGRVQGVGFRFTVRQIASRYDLTGFVRNLPDGTVEMFVQGSTDDVALCLRDIGESFAGYVKNAKIEDVSPDARFDGFSIAF
ncbi:MAG: acylphosphatase [Planctomycetota bacterium]|nr:MAG: acylphosphatase [Planctomycetota bacterium]